MAPRARAPATRRGLAALVLLVGAGEEVREVRGAAAPKRIRTYSDLVPVFGEDGEGGARHHSQEKEELALYEMFFAGQRGGTFVEMGALDGVTFSNTLLYESVLNWTGVLIEANPASCAKLFVNRPRARCLCSAVSANSSSITFETGHHAATFAALDKMSAGFRNRWHGPARGVPRATKLAVPSEPLGKLLRAVGVASVDLFSLDVEGSELQVLQTFDWSIPVRVWCIEVDEAAERGAVRREIGALLASKGYRNVPWHHGQGDGAMPLARNELWVQAAPWTPAQYAWRQWVPP